MRRIWWHVGLLSLLLFLAGMPGVLTAQPFHTLNQESVGVVDATRAPYGTALSSSTLAAAIAGQAGAPRTIFLKCGTWVISANLSVPATIRLWVPLCTTVQVSAGMTLTLNSPPLVEQAAWHTGPGSVVLNYAIPGASVGAAGQLQAADGTGGLAAYSGSGACGAGLFMTALLPSGLKVCGTPVSPSTTGHLLTDRAEPLIPNAVNLATLPSGLLQTAVSGGIATVSTVPVPAGGLAGLSGPQTLNNTFVPLRVTPLPANVTPLVFDMTSTDLAAVSELLQDTLIGTPTGSATTARLVWFILHSTVPRLLTWDTGWSAEMGVPLPTTTSGGSTSDALLFQYNASTGKLALLYNTQVAHPQVSGVTPGAYTCPATLTVDSAGRVTAITSGACGGGGGTPAGSAGDIQLNGGGVLAADTGSFEHDRSTHTTYTQGLQAGAGSGYQEFTDAAGHKGWLFPADLTTDQAWKLPNKSGTVAMLSDVVGGPGGTPGGATTQAQYNLAGAFAGSTGLTFDATSILTRKEAVTAVSANTTLGAHTIVYCTAGATDKTMTLPAASATTVGYYRVVKADAGAGTCLVAPAGADTLNGVAGTRAATTQWSQVEATLVSSTNWHVVSGKTAVALSTDVTGTLPAANFPALTGDCTTTAGSLAVTCTRLNGTAFAGTNGNIVSFGSGNTPADSGISAANLRKRALVFELGDEQGAALATTAVSYVTIPFSCTISAYALTTDAADTTFRVKFWRVADGGSVKPAVGNSISTAGLGVPSGTHVKSSTVTDFTSTAISAYDTVAMNLATANTVKYISATLECIQ